MDMDPIVRLRNKIKTIERRRDDLTKSINQDTANLDQLRQQIDEKRTAADSQAQKTTENKAKLERVDTLIAKVEESLKKIIETSLALEKALEQEVVAGGAP